MKRLFIALFLSSSLLVNAQGVEQGNVIIDASYGWPNLWTTTFSRTIEQGGNVEGLTIKGLGPIHGKVLYMVGDRFDIGVEVVFANSNFNYNETFDNTGTGGTVDTYNYDLNIDRLRVMARFDFHYTTGSAVDLYGGIGTGYKNSVWTTTTDDPSGEATASVTNIIPIAFRLVPVGLRYFFHENIGLNVEMGFGGGGLLTGGLAAKF